jgi:NAD(P)H-nitrite reductase large subunit
MSAAGPYVHDVGFYAEHDVELRTSTTVERISPTTSEVSLAGGETLRFDRLLLTIGARPRRLTLPGGDLDRVLPPGVLASLHTYMCCPRHRPRAVDQRGPRCSAAT